MPVVFGDPVATLANHIRAALADAAPGTVAHGVTVGTRTPTDRRPTSGPTPLIVVTADGPGTTQGRTANLRAPVRITVWHHTEDDAYDLAALAWGYALLHRSADVRSVLPALTPLRASDPDTGEPMSWCTVTANASPRDINNH